MEGKEINTETTAPTQISGLTTTSYAAAVKGNSPHKQEIQQLRTQLQERDDAIDDLKKQFQSFKTNSDKRTLELINIALNNYQLAVPPPLKRTSGESLLNRDRKRSDIRNTPQRTIEGESPDATMEDNSDATTQDNVESTCQDKEDKIF